MGTRQSFESPMSPEECRAVLGREMPRPPWLRYRLSGTRELASEPRPDGSLTVWEVPSGFRTPVHVADVRLAPAAGGSTVDVAFRFATSRVVVSLLGGVLMAMLAFAIMVLVTVLMPPTASVSPRAQTDGLNGGLVLVTLNLSLLIVLLVAVRVVRRQRVAAVDLVVPRLRELLRAR